MYPIVLHIFNNTATHLCKQKVLKSKGIPRQAEVALGVPGRLRPRIISTFGTTRVVGRQPYAPAAFTPGKMVLSEGTMEKNPQWIDPRTVRLVAQRLNHYATLGPKQKVLHGRKT